MGVRGDADWLATSVAKALADVLEVAGICGRAVDQARVASRAGMWAYRTDVAAYHAHRRVLDPTLPARPDDAEGRGRPWFRVLDAGVRQCLAMQEHAAEEVRLLYTLLNSTAMLDAARVLRPPR